VAAVADVAAGLVGGAGLGRRLDGVGLEVADLVPVGAKCGVTRKAVILEGVLDLGQGPGRPMTSFAGIWPWHLRQVVSGLTCLRRVKP
jgi:hypothetical protein